MDRPNIEQDQVLYTHNKSKGILYTGSSYCHNSQNRKDKCHCLMFCWQTKDTMCRMQHYLNNSYKSNGMINILGKDPRTFRYCKDKYFLTGICHCSMRYNYSGICYSSHKQRYIRDRMELRHRNSELNKDTLIQQKGIYDLQLSRNLCSQQILQNKSNKRHDKLHTLRHYHFKRTFTCMYRVEETFQQVI